MSRTFAHRDDNPTARALDARRRELEARAYERKFMSVAPASHEDAPLFVKPEPVNSDLFKVKR